MQAAECYRPDCLKEISTMMEQSRYLFQGFPGLCRVASIPSLREVYRLCIRNIREICAKFRFLADIRDLAFQIFALYLGKTVDNYLMEGNVVSAVGRDRLKDASSCSVVISSKFVTQKKYLNHGGSSFYQELQCEILAALDYLVLPQVTPTSFINKLLKGLPSSPSLTSVENFAAMADFSVGELMEEPEAIAFASSTIAVAALIRSLPVELKKVFAEGLPVVCLPVEENTIFDEFPLAQRRRMLDVSRCMQLMDISCQRYVEEQLNRKRKANVVTPEEEPSSTPCNDENGGEELLVKSTSPTSVTATARHEVEAAGNTMKNVVETGTEKRKRFSTNDLPVTAGASGSTSKKS